MSVFRNRSRCNCCPREPGSYKEMKRMIEKLNYRDNSASSKIPDLLSIFKEIEADKHAYEACCQERKAKIKNLEKNNLNVSQHEGLRKSKSSLGGSHARLSEIYPAPLAHGSLFCNRKPKWLEKHEKKLQQEAKAELEKNMAARFENQVKKLEAQEKFQRVLKANQKRSVRWRLEKEQELRKLKGDINGQEKIKEENLSKFRQDCSCAVNNKNVPLPDKLPKAKDVKVPHIYSLREKPHLLFEIKKHNTTNVGAKFSWNFRQMVKTKAVPKPKISKTFDKLVKGRYVEMPESLPALKSRDKIPLEGIFKKEKKEFHKSKLIDESEPNYGVSETRESEHEPSGDVKPKYTELFQKMLTGEEEKNPELNEVLMSHHDIYPDKKKAGKSSSGSRKARPIIKSEMLKGKKQIIPELNEALMRPKTESDPNKKFSRNKISRLSSSGDVKPKFTKQFHKMLRGTEKDIPELNESLMSQHEIVPDMKRAGSRKHRLKTESRGIKEDIPELNKDLMSQHELLPDIKNAGSRKPRPKTKSEPNYGVSKTDKSKHLPSGEVQPKFSEQFYETLRGQEVDIPELNEALMSHHEMFPKIKRARKSSSGFTKSRVSQIDKARPLQPSHDFLKADHQYENISVRSILKGKTLLSSHQMLQFKDKKGYNAKNKKRKSSILTLEKRRSFALGRKLKQFSYYIKNSAADQRIIRQIGSKSSIAYLKKSLTSLISEKSGSVRPCETTAENSGRPSSSVISTSDMAQSLLAASENEEELEDFSDGNELMFDTLPEDNHSHHHQNLYEKKTVSKLIDSIAKTGKKMRMKHRPKPSKNQSNLEQRDSSISLKPFHDKIKLAEIQALMKYACPEKYLVEEKAVVQARIQELMKYVVIREDFQPPKPPRNFIRENIEMLQMRPQKKAQAQKQRKPNRKYRSLMEKLRMPEVTDYRSSGQQGSDTMHEQCMKKLCCRRQDQLEHHQAKPPAGTVDAEAQKCDTLEVCTNGNSNPGSNYIEKTKAKKLRESEKRKEAWTHEENEEEWCPKDC